MEIFNMVKKTFNFEYFEIGLVDCSQALWLEG